MLILLVRPIQSSRRTRVRTNRYGNAPEEVPPHIPTEEELRLASSDLEDCKEIWDQALGQYMVEIQKRHNQVEDWFFSNCIVSTCPTLRFKAKILSR